MDAVPAKVPVIFDSGIQNGSDILKALALGAKAVCLGRAPRWGLAAYGAGRCAASAGDFQAELVMAMAQTGRPDLASIDRTLVRTTSDEQKILLQDARHWQVSAPWPQPLSPWRNDSPSID